MVYLICDRCGYTIDAKPYHADTRCSQCDMGVMEVLTDKHLKYEGCDNNPAFKCPVPETARDWTCRKTGYCPLADDEGCC